MDKYESKYVSHKLLSSFMSLISLDVPLSLPEEIEMTMSALVGFYED
jgi:hypothetical protein